MPGCQSDRDVLEAPESTSDIKPSVFVTATYLKPQKSDPLRRIVHETSGTVFTSEYQVWSLQNGVNQIRGVSIFHSFNPQTRFMTWLDRDLSTPWHVQVTRVAQMTMTQNFSVGRCHGSWRSLAAGETAPSLLSDGPFWRLGSSLQITLLSCYTRLIHIITGIPPSDTIC